VIGGTPDFIHYPADDLVFNILRDQPESSPTSSHQLPPPHADEEFRGDIVILKLVSGIRSEPFTVANYQDWVLNYQYESDDESDEESDEEDELTPLQALLLEKVITDFTTKNGREPTEEEMERLLEVMNEEAEAEEDPENAEEVVEMLKTQIRAAFQAQQGREPTETEWAVIMMKLTGEALPEEHQKPTSAVEPTEPIVYAEEDV